MKVKVPFGVWCSIRVECGTDVGALYIVTSTIESDRGPIVLGATPFREYESTNTSAGKGKQETNHDNKDKKIME